VHHSPLPSCSPSYSNEILNILYLSFYCDYHSSFCYDITCFLYVIFFAFLDTSHYGGDLFLLSSF
jgi:hypothetical protein